MSNIAKHTLGIALAVGLTAAALTLHTRSKRSGDELRALRERVESLENSPRERVLTIRETSAAAVPAGGGRVPAEQPADEGLAKPDPSETARRTHEDQAERDRRLTAVNEARSEACDTTHGHETPDPTWSAGAADTIRARLVGEAFQGVGSTVDCRRTMCKVELKYGDRTSGLEAVRELGSLRLWRGQTFWHLDQARLEGVAYIAREGFQLPTGDPEVIN